MGNRTVLQPSKLSDAEWQVRCDLAARASMPAL